MSGKLFLILIVSLSYLTHQFYSQIVFSNYLVYSKSSPTTLAAFPGISAITGFDFIRCLMICSNNGGCNSMTFVNNTDYTKTQCSFLIGRVSNASDLTASATTNYYEKHCRIYF